MCKHFFFVWITGILLSFCCGPLGSFILWRQMSSFGNMLSHASLLGLACALLFNINRVFTVLVILILLTIIIIYIERMSNLSMDTILGIITYSSLSIGMIILHFISKDEKSDLTQYLLGNVLQLTGIDINIIVIMTLIICSIILFFWKSMLLMIINVELAQVSGINIFNMRLILMILTAFLIGISTTLIGALLITAILIIPPAISQKFSTSPEHMVVFSICINVISITIGIIISIIYNIPISSIIILIESIIFLISVMI
ncbi:High-affinity zinc uptake system membrane protein ZnuB [Buchnera aphidicola (Takecallis arundicolens)]|uniref:iron chelate uptake ABC transporter family permease subunit n=1 Tax=Buchnera aphidicola TaxID=9 RepID=UPI003464097A